MRRFIVAVSVLFTTLLGLGSLRSSVPEVSVSDMETAAKGGSAKIEWLSAYVQARRLMAKNNDAAAIPYLCKAAVSRTCSADINAMSTQLRKGEKTPMYALALLQAARVAERRGENEQAWKILEAIPSVSEPLERSIFFEKFNSAKRFDSAKAKRIGEELEKKYPDAETYLRLGLWHESRHEFSEARVYYLKTLAHPENDSTYLQAAKSLRGITHSKYRGKDESDYEVEVRLAEAARIEKQYDESERLFAKVEEDKLSPEIFYYYVKNRSRLLISLKKYSDAVSFATKNLPRISNTHYKDEILSDLSNRLIRPDEYKLILELVPEKYPGGEQAMYNRVISLYKTGSSKRSSEADFYLEKFNRYSYYADKTYFSACLDDLLEGKKAKAQSCLEGLRTRTTGTCTGGKSRFHLARLAEENGDKEKANGFYREVYLNSPESFWVIESLNRAAQQDYTLPENPSVETVRQLVAQSGGREDFRRDFFKKKRETPDYAIDPFWKETEKKADSSFENSEDTARIGFLLYAAGLYNEGMFYLRSMPVAERNLLLFHSGELAKDDRRTHYYLRSYAREMHKQIDIFLMSPRALKAFYPVPFRSAVHEASERFSIEEAKIYAIMKQESMFNPRARSYANARGLMQLLPSTAKALNRSVKLRGLDLYDPRDNILLGTKFMADLFSYYSSDLEKVAVAYNAGPGRLNDWNKIYSSDIYFFIEQIPFQQTHHYVKVIRREYDRYSLLLDYYYPEDTDDT